MTDKMAQETSFAPYPAPIPVPSSADRPEGADIAAPIPPKASPPATPPLGHKLLFWFILSAFSVFFAEVVSGSTQFPFFNPYKPWDVWGWAVEMPLYGIHTLVLAGFIFKIGKPRFESVFFAGVLFGLYEAYITKVLWAPTWGPPVWSLGGVALVELVVISFWWHPFMSFAIPLAAAETALTSSREVLGGLPAKVRSVLARRGRLLFVLFAAWAGATHGGADLVPAMLSSIISAGVLLGLVHLWKKWTAGAAYSLRQLLPDGMQTAKLFAVLVFIYILLGGSLLRERIPGPAAQAPVWAMYAIFIGLLVVSLKKGRYRPDAGPALDPRLSDKVLLWFFVIFTAVSILINRFSVIVLVASWFLGIAIGIGALAWSVREALARPGEGHSSSAAGHSQS